MARKPTVAELIREINSLKQTVKIQSEELAKVRGAFDLCSQCNGAHAQKGDPDNSVYCERHDKRILDLVIAEDEAAYSKSETKIAKLQREIDNLSEELEGSITDDRAEELEAQYETEKARADSFDEELEASREFIRALGVTDFEFSVLSPEQVLTRLFQRIAA